jgi:hypothetical protein
LKDPDSRAFLPVVDAHTLDPDRREALRPGGVVLDQRGVSRELPRFFYEVDSEHTARHTRLAPGFSMWEFLETGVREAEVLRQYPKYIPCAVTLLAAHLAVLRKEIGRSMHIAANGGYRSPAHAQSFVGSRHQWGTAVNIFRIGSDNLNDQGIIDRYRKVATKILPGVWIRPFGHTVGTTSDHLHLDLGYVVSAPLITALPAN